jgi:hypothetical protein
MATSILFFATGAGRKNSRVGKEVAVAAPTDRLAAELAKTLGELPAETDAWLSPHTFAVAEDAPYGHRRQSAWQSAAFVAIDIDLRSAGGQKIRLDSPEGAPFVQAVEDARAEGRIPGSVLHRTPRGFRVFALFDQQVTDVATFKSAARAVAGEMARWLADAGLEYVKGARAGLEVDSHVTEDTARLLFGPRAIVDGEAREAECVVLRAEPYNAEQLAARAAQDGSQAKVPAAPQPGHPPRGILLSSGSSASEAERRALYMEKVDAPSISGQGGNVPFMRAARAAVEMSRTVDEAVASLMSWDAKMSTPPWGEPECRRAVANVIEKYTQLGVKLDEDRLAGAALPAAANEASAPSETPRAILTERLVYLTATDSYYAATEDRRSIDLGHPKDAQAATKYLVANGFTRSKAKRIVDELLLPCAHTVGCEPDQPYIYTDEAGVLVLNMYIPADVEPAPGEFPVLGAVLSYVTAGDPDAREWLVNWCAFAVQHPTAMSRTAPVLCGAQRTGKSLFCNALRKIMGEKNCASIGNADLSGRFTSHFATKLLVVLSEAEASEVRGARALMKQYTGEAQVRSESKGATPLEVRNRLKWMATSNDTLPVTVEKGDTRWAIFRNDEPAPPEYLAQMAGLFNPDSTWSEAGLRELAAFSHFLQSYPVDLALAADVFKNNSRAEAMALAAGSVETFADALDNGIEDVVGRVTVGTWERDQEVGKLRVPGHPGAVAIGPLYQLYRRFCSTEGYTQPVSAKRFAVDLARARPGWQRHSQESGVDNRLRGPSREKVAAISGPLFAALAEAA